MEKALNVLKDLCLVINFNSYWNPRVEEAIAELEEDMKAKECSKCKHIHQGWWCNENGIRVTLDFCCNRYEAKDTQC